MPRPALGRAALVAVAATALVLPASRRAAADGADDRRNPSIGFVYPAGGRVGAVFQLTAGGQNLGGVSEAVVSGDGVRATVLRHVRPLSSMQQQELRRRVAEIRAERRAAAAAAAAEEEGRRRGGRKRDDPKPRAKDAPKAPAAATTPEEERPKLPDHPLLNALDRLSDEALEQVLTRFIGAKGKQINPQIAESVEVEVEIAPGTPPGEREIRFRTNGGLTNPLRFEVGVLPETVEAEWATAGSAQPVLTVPVLVNGQILPGDVDRFRLRARRGQRLVVDAHARALVPFLADAVPGWFQATLSVIDANGREIAYSDDAGYEPDPRLAFDVPADGDYTVEIRDALYRGREDFVYRIAVTEDPLLATTPSVAPETAPATIRVPHAADALPHVDEAETNDDPEHAQPLTLPVVVRGRIARPGDVDAYSFRGLAGDDVVLDVEGRRLRSPVDSCVRLIGPAGDVVAWNDDFADGEAGTITHHADSYLRAKLPADGTYVVRVHDVQGHGGPEFAYELRVGPPLPDFELVITPSSLSLRPGSAIPFRAHVVRKDGYAGPVTLSLAGAPPGFVLSGGTIGAGIASSRLTLTVPRDVPDGPIALRVEGRGTSGSREIVRPAVPAEDRMQAFAYRHLAPSLDLAVSTAGPRRGGAPAEPLTPEVRVAAGGNVRADFRVPVLPAGADVRVELDQPPPGISVAGFEVRAAGLVVLLHADATAKPGATENLVLEVLAGAVAGRGRGAQRLSLGYLPAISCVVLPAEAEPPAR